MCRSETQQGHSPPALHPGAATEPPEWPYWCKVSAVAFPGSPFYSRFWHGSFPWQPYLLGILSSMVKGQTKTPPAITLRYSGESIRPGIRHLNVICSLPEHGKLAALQIHRLKLDLLPPTLEIRHECTVLITMVGDKTNDSYHYCTFVSISVEFSLGFWEILKIRTRIKFKDHVSNHILLYRSWLFQLT